MRSVATSNVVFPRLLETIFIKSENSNVLVMVANDIHFFQLSLVISVSSLIIKLPFCTLNHPTAYRSLQLPIVASLTSIVNTLQPVSFRSTPNIPPQLPRPIIDPSSVFIHHTRLQFITVPSVTKSLVNLFPLWHLHQIGCLASIFFANVHCFHFDHTHPAHGESVRWQQEISSGGVLTGDKIIPFILRLLT